jgi:ATP-dependent DNA ligase
MWNQIAEGRNPITGEGVVVHPEFGTPTKAKLLEDQDVTIRDIFPGAGKYKGKGAGGFTYSLGEGPTLGRVGTGLSDALRQELFSNPDEYIGRMARVRSQGAFPSGALRAPSLLALRDD